MGGKGSDSSPEMWPQQEAHSPDAGMYLEAFSAMMESNQKNMEALIQQQQSIMPPLPEIVTPSAVDWTDEGSKLAAKTKADQSIKDKQKRGRTSTILTSPLLDEEDANTTEAVLGK